ncbi:MAG: Ig-like domain-containing protein [Gemmatimonadota bacterium]|nr:Ig-like domain-containing protein [Gemmatimonadota bacterium]
MKIFSRIGFSLVMTLLVFNACAGSKDCGGIVCTTTEVKAVTVSLTPVNLALDVGATAQLAVSITGGSPTPGLASCTSTATNVVTASVGNASSTGYCQVIAVGPGNATVTAVATGGAQASSSVMVTSRPALTAFTVSPANAVLVVGQTQTLTPTPTRAAPSITVTYSFQSSAVDVVAVSTGGIVTAVAPGTANITVTATGSGTGYVTTTLTSIVAVTASCLVVDKVLDFTAFGTISNSDCPVPGFSTIADYFRVTLAAPRVVLLSANSAFDTVGVFAEEQNSTLRSVVFRSNSRTATGVYFLPAGATRLGVFAGSGRGAYTFSVTAQAEDVNGCRDVVIMNSITTLQNLTQESCTASTSPSPFDRFYLYGPGRSCTVEMRSATGANALFDPYLEAWRQDESAIVDENDDIVLNVDRNARLQFAECVDPARGLLTIRARAFVPTSGTRPPDYGQYVLVVTYSASSASVRTERSVIARP